MKEINEKLTIIRTKMRQKERLTSALVKVSVEKDRTKQRKNELYNKLKKEQLDVENLETLSLSNFLHTVLGNKVEKLMKEKEEFISAKFRYDTAIVELENLEGEVNRLESMINDFGDLNKEYSQLIKEKESILKTNYSSIKERLDSLLEDEAKLASENKELNEAIQAGSQLLASLYRVQESLNSAGNWGTWDILGGGFISTMAKHSKIDDAQREINDAQYHIKRFHRELQDIGGEMDLSLEIGSFLTFADYFFDGLFSDLAVQSKIRDAQERIREAQYKVDHVLNNLRKRLNENTIRIKTFKNERINIIEES